jgi:hypothetical protein
LIYGLQISWSNDIFVAVLTSSAMSSSKQQNNIVAGTSQGDTTIDVHKLLDKRWYQYPHLRRLYAWMSVVLLVQATNGLDGSIMNGMQTLTYWNKYAAILSITIEQH